MPGQIKTPTNQKLLTNVAIVRIKKHGKRFEIACYKILEKGDLQVSDKERHVTSESSFKELANLIANMCVNPETKRPYSSAVIEKALHELHFNLNTNRSAKQHALEAIPKLREHIPIDRANMRIRVFIPAKNAKNVHDRLKALFSSIEIEDWEKGDLAIVGLVNPGNYKDILEIVRADKKAHGELELLSLKVISESEIEIT